MVAVSASELRKFWTCTSTAHISTGAAVVCPSPSIAALALTSTVTRQWSSSSGHRLGIHNRLLLMLMVPSSFRVDHTPARHRWGQHGLHIYHTSSLWQTSS